MNRLGVALTFAALATIGSPRADTIQASSTVFLERQFEIMAKLVYEQTYAMREVK